jgi:asparagine synthase (glutamine-hydrolysing)
MELCRSVTPFYSIKFFEYAMNCPDEIKKNYGLYRGFLLLLSPQSSAIDNANWERPITSKKLGIIDYIHKYIRLLSKVKRIVKIMLKKNGNLFENNSNIMNCALEQIENCKSISKYLSSQDIKKVINNSNEINNIFTITSVIEEFECTKSTIEKYYESDFT